MSVQWWIHCDTTIGRDEVINLSGRFLVQVKVQSL